MDETEDEKTPMDRVAEVVDLAGSLRESVGRLERIANEATAGQAEAQQRAAEFARRLRHDPTIIYSRTEPSDS
jgi:hypothetical protein